MASKGGALEFLSAFGKSISKPLFSSNLSSSASVSRTPSFTGPSGVIENLSSLHAELDGLLGETEENSGTIRSNSYDGNKQARYLLRIRRSHWKDASKTQTCMRCSKSFSFTSKKFNCRRFV